MLPCSSGDADAALSNDGAAETSGGSARRITTVWVLLQITSFCLFVLSDRVLWSLD